MEARQEPEIPDGGGGTEAEDIPSDFFDEFSKEEFIEGLSIIDSWDEGVHSGERSRKPKFTDSVKDINEFTLDDNLETTKQVITKKKKEVKQSQSPNSSRLDEFIKPGSRRDPTKTNEAIKKDKEEKVKEYLAKSLESSEDLRPPGTELEGYFDLNTQAKMEKVPTKQKLGSQPRSRSRERQARDSPMKQSHRSRDSPSKISHRPRWSPKRSPRRSPRRSSPSRRSPRRNHLRGYSPQKNYRYAGNNRRSSPNRRSPRRFSPRRSPRRASPRRSPKRSRRSRSRSPYKRSYESRHSRSRSPNRNLSDRFLYQDPEPPFPTMGVPYHMAPGFSGLGPEFPVGPGYPYPPAYPGGYTPNSPYEFGGQPLGPRGMPPPQAIPSPLMSLPVPMPNPVPAPPATIPVPPNPTSVPMMVPAPNLISPNLPKQSPATRPEAKTPYDALAKLVAEGKISKADYLKLAPNKGSSSITEDSHRVGVLNRCNQAINKLAKLQLPNHLLMNNSMLDVRSDPKFIAPKFCSPLKRQAPIEFLFTKANLSATAQQNKHLVDSIIASLPELEKVITRPKKKAPKNMKDAAVQTSKPFCDVCEIRENTQFNSISTSVDPDYFYSTVHTQVVEQDLVNSKTVFNPSGSVGEGAAMSIAHLTPAQLVSQLAARAKTLKHPAQNDAVPPNQYQRNSSNSYDYEYDGRGGQQYQNYNNYRY